jgi:outer membrane lipoprotein-sorting protein
MQMRKPQFRGTAARTGLHMVSSVILFLLVSASSGKGQTVILQTSIVSQPSLEQVVDKLVAKNAERAAALQRYQSRRFYRLEYTGFPTSLKAEMVVDMVYEAPATKTFKIVSQSGPKWMIDRIFKGLLQAEQEGLKNRERVELNRNNYAFSGMEIKDGGDGCAYVLAVQPKIPNKLLYRGRIWVNSKDFAVCRIEAEPAKNPSIWIKNTAIHHIYQKFGDFWFPSENQSTSTMRVGGRAVLSIKYQNYEILAARPLEETDSERSELRRSSISAPLSNRVE